MDAKKPGDYPRRILLAVTGLSPQIVTETLYALAVGNEEKFIPTEVHIISTENGAEQAKLSLLSQKRRWFARLLEDYNLPAISFSENHIHTVKDSNGVPLNDIRSQADNEQIANYITEKIRQFSADQNAALHVSIAGGRKTMGFYLGYALSLYGRAQDRLSHVLVSQPYESSREFFYPTPYENSITLHSGQEADAKKAKVSLADIPFVRMRHGLSESLRDGKTSFMQTVTTANENLGPAKLDIDIQQQKLRGGSKIISIAPKQLAMLSLFARRALNNQAPLPAPHKELPEKEWAERFLNEYREIRNGELEDKERTEQALKNGMDGSYFSECKTQLHNKLKQKLGTAATPYLISDGSTRPRRYALELPPQAITFTDIPKPQSETDKQSTLTKDITSL